MFSDDLFDVFNESGSGTVESSETSGSNKRKDKKPATTSTASNAELPADASQANSSRSVLYWLRIYFFRRLCDEMPQRNYE
jgi:hypothetical protein